MNDLTLFVPLFFPAWATLVGACLGSFYAVCMQRSLTGRGLGGRSRCETCGQTLRPWHLVPLVSWLVLRGRCAFCGAAIGWPCLLVELVSALTALLLALRFGPSLVFWVLLLVTGALVVAAGIDLAGFILPDRITLPLAVAALPIAVFLLEQSWLNSLLGGLGGAGLLYALMAGFRRWRGVEALGLGDVKLMLSLGFLCGLTAVPNLLLIASLAGLAASPCWLLTRRAGQNLRQTPIPFGPFLALGGFLTLLYGPLTF